MSAEIAPRDGTDVAGRMARIDELVAGLQEVDPAARSLAEELLGEVLALHSDALTATLRLLRAQPDGSEVALGALAADELVRSVLLIHDLHPEPLTARVEAALESVRPMLHGHKGDIELLGIDDTVVRLRLAGACDGCASSELTMKAAVETALYAAAPELTGVEVESASAAPHPAPAFDCLVPLQMASPRAPAPAG